MSSCLAFVLENCRAAVKVPPTTVKNKFYFLKIHRTYLTLALIVDTERVVLVAQVVEKKCAISKVTSSNPTLVGPNIKQCVNR